MKNDRLLGIFVLGLGIVLYAATSNFPGAATYRPGPAFLPRILAVLFGICGLILIFGRTTEPEGETVPSPRAWMKALGLIIGLFFYVAVVDHVGFLIAASGLAVAVFLLFGGSLSGSVIATLILVPAVYMLFSTILGVVLPVGWLGW